MNSSETLYKSLARVDLDAVEYNIEMMKKNIQKDTQMMAVIKMDGYGHGAVQIAKLLEPKDYIWGYAVATLDEAILLKDACLKKPVLEFLDAFSRISGIR